MEKNRCGHEAEGDTHQTVAYTSQWSSSVCEDISFIRIGLPFKSYGRNNLGNCSYLGSSRSSSSFQMIYLCLVYPLSFTNPVSCPPSHLVSHPSSAAFSRSFLPFSLHCEQLTAVSLKSLAYVLSCPLVPSLHWSDLELCQLKMGVHFDVGREDCVVGRCYDVALYIPFNSFP